MKDLMLKTFVCMIVASLTMFSLPGTTSLAEEPLAPRPPMGWNSFDSYGVYLHEKAAMENLEAMAEKLKPHGYEFFVDR